MKGEFRGWRAVAGRELLRQVSAAAVGTRAVGTSLYLLLASQRLRSVESSLADQLVTALTHELFVDGDEQVGLLVQHPSLLLHPFRPRTGGSEIV